MQPTLQLPQGRRPRLVRGFVIISNIVVIVNKDIVSINQSIVIIVM